MPLKYNTEEIYNYTPPLSLCPALSEMLWCPGVQARGHKRVNSAAMEWPVAAWRPVSRESAGQLVALQRFKRMVLMCGKKENGWHRSARPGRLDEHCPSVHMEQSPTVPSI